GYDISEDALKDGLKNAEWSARLEVVKNADERFGLRVPKGKILVFDGAHNPHGATELAGAIKDYFGGKRIHLVMGMLADKDVDGVVNLLAPLAERATAITPNSPRALDKSDLCEKISKHVSCDVAEDMKSGTNNKYIASDIKSAVQSALDSECEVVILCGSLTLFGII
ncbi:MAG: hypothetical protein K2M36_03860, partial [Clostridia bacterium]|nr:hypothetical protein [Clostridia bacterium]